MALRFSSTHQMQMAVTWAIVDLYLNPEYITLLRVEAMVPFTFSQGANVPAGNLVAIPQREIMRDSTRYTSPESFNPYRFMTDSSTEAVSRYTDVNWDYTFWGSPHLPCPGRWYASYAMKHVLVHLLTTYDVELLNPQAKKCFTWTTAIVPKSNMCIRVSKRDVGGGAS
ncbi:cytochrome P450 [Byssothecium circinans]|uniref:Cytochrome P450 n=1 Tax=Byssothecium circinans TaxID=147558 RepID=A0A6A5TPB3_9PLEO|nr:cytochrome P450 [Byssothecium circinans]